MEIKTFPFQTLDWSGIDAEIQPGTTGTATRKIFQMSDTRVRMVEYSPGYLADHWCSKGHILLCLEGELTVELQDGRIFILTPGISYQVADGAEPHRSHTTTGVKLFIVD